MTRYIYPLILLLAAFLAGCRDDFNYEPIGEGEATVSATVCFHPLLSAPVNDEYSRTAGDSIQNIRNIQVVVYKANNEYVGIYRFGEGFADSFTTTGTQTGKPDDVTDEEKSESSTATATFKINDLPYGRYKMYIVANYTPLVEADIQTPRELMNHKATWNDKSVSKNDQMFGVFATDNQSGYEDAPVITINQATVTLTGWIKRLASKVTIVYDGKGLHEGINIYIKSVSIRDIPKKCVLNFDMANRTEQQVKDNVNGNNPTEGELINQPKHGTLYYKTVYKSDLSTTVDSIETTDTDPNVQDWHDWLHITKSTEALGAVLVNKNHEYEKDPEGNIITHTEDMQALFFYENCQGNYPDQEAYDKEPKVGDVGKDENHEDVYKDRVRAGTYIEVDAYYVSSNPKNQSSGPIKYRFMLGQDGRYNYNALRNRHYKLFLGFRGYANQPEWHIVYNEEEPGLYPLPQYNVSYMYNTRQEMPIRLTGKPYKVTLQIIENNWAPYEPHVPDSVPADSVSGPARDKFRWYRALYLQSETNAYQGNAGDYPIKNIILQSYSTRPESSIDGLQYYFYGLHKRSEYDSWIKYEPALESKYLKEEQKVTPIWAGFLALQVAHNYNSYETVLPTGVQNDPAYSYSSTTTVQGMRNYYTGNGGSDSNGNSNNTVKQYQCTFEFSQYTLSKENKLEKNKEVNIKSDYTGAITTGRNAAVLSNNGDGSYTLTAPLFTTPKAIGYISGFTGNNPYEAYRRRAKILITAYYKVGDDDKILRQIVPVFQQRRVVNPKAVWRSGTKKDPFTVKLCELPAPDAANFSQIESEGEWTAWVASPNGKDETPNTASFITLSGANGIDKTDNKLHGSTGSKIEFDINFTGTTTGSQCAKVIVSYHGNTCEHAIYVRQGYSTPLAIADKGKQWSSFSVFAFNGADMTGSATSTTNPAANPNMMCEMTVNPLALGTLYKRGNYGQGIGIINNETWPVMVNLNGDLQLIKLNADQNLTHNNSGRATWGNIRGNTATGWKWSSFKGAIPGSTNTYTYDLPTLSDFQALANEDFGYGVMYADGASTTALTTAEAYGYFNKYNSTDMVESTLGMRGVIVYNKKTFNQVFFPIGSLGVGRRTMETLATTDNAGYLRYGGVFWTLSTATAAANQYRPITYNMPSSPGAIYWIKQTSNKLSAWDINYFDLSFNGYQVVLNTNYGDALPIKPIVTGINNQ